MLRISLGCTVCLTTFLTACSSESPESLNQADELVTTSDSHYFYTGPVPTLDTPSVTLSLKGHTVRVSGYLPANYDVTTEVLSLPNLRSWERRVVHTFLQDDKEVTSESAGEGRERTLIIKPRV